MARRKLMANSEIATLLDMMDRDPITLPRKKKPRKKRLMAEAYPDYGKSLVSQEKGDPVTSGLIRGAGYGTVGAILGALASKMSGQNNNKMVMASILGGLAGGIPGYYSGRNEQESLNSKLLFLRRMGVDNPGELEALEAYPGLARKLTTEGVKV